MNNTRDSYKLYRSKVEKPDKPVKIKDYIDIVNGFMKFAMSKVFEGYEIELPLIGNIAIQGVKRTPKLDENGEIYGLAPSWAKTKELWDSNPEAKSERILAYCFNEHTNSVRYHIAWLKRDVKIINKNLYTLKFMRKNKRTVRDLILSGKEYYVKPKNNYNGNKVNKSIES